MSETPATAADPPPAAAATGSGRIARPFNPMDSLMLATNETLVRAGVSGFETQMLVWLDGRLDRERLRRAVVRLGRRYPIITARLVLPRFRTPYWRARPGAEATLHETALDSAERDAVLDRAAELLSTPHDLTAADPIQFHLLRRPDGRDVFLMQYNHVLMDNAAATLALRELDRLSEPDADDLGTPAGEDADPMVEYLHGFPRGRRLRAAGRLADIRVRRLRFRPKVLSAADVEARGPRRVRIIARHIDPETTQRLLARVVEVCRLPGMSMALLASAFRSLGRLAPPQVGRQNYIAGIGVDLGLRGPEGPIFQNLVSLFPVAAREEELADRDGLMRTLNHQLRERLTQDIDLGALELVRLFRRFRRFFHRSTSRLVRNNYSLWYAFFGPVDAVGERFCGTGMADVLFTGPCWPPMGLTLLVNQFRGRTSFQVTYIPELVSDDLANRFLDTVVDDLVRFTSGD